VVVVAAAQDPADAVERIAGASAVPEGLLLDPAADLVDRIEAELNDVEHSKILSWPSRMVHQTRLNGA
jgi:hypothetical protein